MTSAGIVEEQQVEISEGDHFKALKQKGGLKKASTLLIHVLPSWRSKQNKGTDRLLFSKMVIAESLILMQRVYSLQYLKTRIAISLLFFQIMKCLYYVLWPNS